MNVDFCVGMSGRAMPYSGILLFYRNSRALVVVSLGGRVGKRFKGIVLNLDFYFSART